MKRSYSERRSSSRSESPPRPGPQPESHFETQSQSESSPQWRFFCFRILVMGKANTGKTTLLDKICSETDVPMVRDLHGNEIHLVDGLNPTPDRGLHDINHEITYLSRPGFVFHDSRGLEAGSIAEVEMILDFIKRRARMEKEEALHVIWYCISGDDDRPLNAAEEQFFNLDKGKVPVVVAFTKYDALELKAEGELERENPTDEPTEQEISARAEQIFQEHFLKRVMATPYPPAAYVRLKELDTPEGDCTELTRQTARVVEDKHLQGLFALASSYDLETRLSAITHL